MNIQVSLVATQKVLEMMEAEALQDAFLRIRVQTGGCSGFTYAMEIAMHAEADDQVFTQQGLGIVIDADSVKYVNGLQVDYKETALGGGFTIENPNAIATCGCGSSFRTKEEAGVPGEC